MLNVELAFKLDNTLNTVIITIILLFILIIL